MGSSKSLKNIICTGCRLGDKSAKMMLEASKNPNLQLERLIFDGNDLGKQGITDLGTFLKKMQNSILEVNIEGCLETESTGLQSFLKSL